MAACHSFCYKDTEDKMTTMCYLKDKKLTGNELTKDVPLHHYVTDTTTFTTYAHYCDKGNTVSTKYTHMSTVFYFYYLPLLTF